MVEPYTTEQAIAALERIGKRWPKDLLLFSWAGSLVVIQLDENGDVTPDTNAGWNDAIIAHIHGIRNDGGDP